jgi:hypothetical protein
MELHAPVTLTLKTASLAGAWPQTVEKEKAPVPAKNLAEF